MKLKNKRGSVTDADAESVHGKMAVMANFVQETTKAELNDTRGEKEMSRTCSSPNGSDANAFKRSLAEENGACQVIIDSKDEKFLKCGRLYSMKQVLLTLAVVCVIAVLIAMTGLYIAERKRRVDLAKKMLEESINGKHHSLIQVMTTRNPPAGTTESPLIKPLVPGCVPLFDAYPLPSIPPEIKNLTNVLNAEVENLFKQHKFKAASVAFSYRGKLWWSKHVGNLNYNDTSSPTPDNDTPYPVASITKVFTTFMLHKLFEKKSIQSLDDPVKKHIPEFSVKNPFNNEQITLRQLSCMMSGLPREGPCFPHLNTNFCPYNSSEMWKKIANLSLVLPPDKNPSYSNLGYSILGRTMEKIVGKKYEDWVKENILKPLGMNNSGFDLLGNANRFPVSTNFDGSLARIVNWGWQQPAGGLFSTINDLNQVAKMLFELSGNTSVLDKSSTRKLFKPAYLYNTGHGTGYGFEILNSGFQRAAAQKGKNALQYLIYAKNGACLGYGAWIAFIPEFKFAAFALVAHAGNEFIAGALLGTALKAVLPLEQVLVRRLPTYVLPPSPEIFIGSYKLVQYWPLINNHVLIYQHNGKIFMKMEWLIVPVSYVSSWTLITGHFKQYPLGQCEDNFLGTGLSNMKLHFRRPTKSGGKSPGFHINGIATYGFIDFVRVL